MDFEKIGRGRMMMRLPRHRRQISDANFLAMTHLLEAYGEAAMKRDKLREQLTPEHTMLEEYETLCQTLEDDIIKVLASVSPRIVR
ncbi:MULTISPECIES: hypothetical protein [unclassified Ensifer]|uniref:hypothetical protein n=1 Tax=unclassified Ensifer TaxID=2633371 RepID=UPI00070B19F1|nr:MULTISPECIES: hypothetical protein [unclassified Ensifer]KQW60565.1 hypothetical protein ASD02_25615 [Ensifer sp. Root1252]KQW72583.1 hypothetical protein ASD03_31435 [Ensifer sp. Root127]KRC79394.1 hypothetical protein ASE32_26150 [Ensifer sp. Root231]KRC99786.1 hypothetical protein ASE47_26510 [Ensifer sp. Root258]